jgi:hypothetical protein
VPFTFFAHQAPLLPLKVWRPAWFDGTALVAGSMVPDFGLGIGDTPVYVGSHAPAVQLWFSTPVAVMLALLVKKVVAPVLAPHLPDLPPFHLRAYAALARWPDTRPTGPAVLVLVSSALVGCLSHLILDSLTHAHGWAVESFPPLQVQVVVLPLGAQGRPFFVYDVLQIGITALGVLISLRYLREWGPEQARRARQVPEAERAATPQPTPASTTRLWVGVAVAWACGMAVTLVCAVLKVGSTKSLVLLPFMVAFAGLVVTCLTVRGEMRPEPVADTVP